MRKLARADFAAALWLVQSHTGIKIRLASQHVILVISVSRDRIGEIAWSAV